MTTDNDVRRAHDLLDELDARAELSQEQETLLRSFLPELPKQKALEEIAHDVYDAWAGADGNEWPDDIHGELETWLSELHIQMQGLKDTPATVLALPTGMRIADHEEIGRVVVSPATDSNGERMIFCLDKTSLTGAGRRWAHEASLTFIDAAPAAPAEPAHPEFLETEADYAAAPEGTIVAHAKNLPCHKYHSEWASVGFWAVKDDRGMSRTRRRVLRWGWEND